MNYTAPYVEKPVVDETIWSATFAVTWETSPTNVHFAPSVLSSSGTWNLTLKEDMPVANPLQFSKYHNNDNFLAQTLQKSLQCRLSHVYLYLPVNCKICNRISQALREIFTSMMCAFMSVVQRISQVCCLILCRAMKVLSIIGVSFFFYLILVFLG